MFDMVPFKKGGSDLFSYFDDMEKGFLQNFGGTFPAFKTDIVDKGDRFVLEAEMPGFTKQDIQIDLDGSTLTVKAEHNAKTEENKGNYIRRERRYGSYARSFDVSDIKTEEIKADYKNGLLVLELPKKEGLPSKSRRIELQ